jgi:nitrile hydratase
MDGVHDLGGMEGFGPIRVEVNEPPFHHDWEARVMAMRVLMSGWRKWNIDAGRHSIECLPPVDYLSLTYYEKWLASLVNLSVAAGLVDREEIASGHPADSSAKATPPVSAEAFLSPSRRGDRVREQSLQLRPFEWGIGFAPRATGIQDIPVFRATCGIAKWKCRPTPTPGSHPTPPKLPAEHPLTVSRT